MRPIASKRILWSRDSKPSHEASPITPMPEDVLAMALTCCNVQRIPNDNIGAMLRGALEMDLSRLD